MALVTRAAVIAVVAGALVILLVCLYLPASSSAIKGVDISAETLVQFPSNKNLPMFIENCPNLIL